VVATDQGQPVAALEDYFMRLTRRDRGVAISARVRLPRHPIEEVTVG